MCLVYLHLVTDVCVCSIVSDSFVTPWTAACQAPVRGIFQAWILEWAAMSFSRRSSQLKLNPHLLLLLHFHVFSLPPVLWPPHAKSWLIGKDSDAGRDWGQEEKGKTEDEMAGWHHWLNGRESEWTPGVGEGQGGLACCDSWGRKESDTTERLIWSEC